MEILIDLSVKPEPTAKPVTGPATPDIRAMFNRINTEKFGGYLPDTFDVKWCNSLRVTAGTCRWIRRGSTYTIEFIRLSIKLFRENGWNLAEIENTLTHEMAHAYLVLRHGISGHGPEFQNLMHRLVGWRKNHTYHAYDVSNLRNIRRNKVEIYCTSCECVIGSRKRKPSAKKIHLYTHVSCGGKVTFRTVPIKSDPNTLFSLSRS
jgi:predicted SprT family Zn-dependent metalloprotease